ncbi:MAG: DUF554 family protein [Candidatus Moranbacteria bacterium]|nr:DUF554 family protein [Candidatus Moranbacteria bacterium]
MTGTLLNATLVILGGLTGMFLSSRLPKALTKMILNVIGLLILILAIGMALEFNQLLIVALSLLFGSTLGQALKLEKRVKRLSQNLKQKIRIKNPEFSQGFITASLVICVGALAIIGPIQEGLGLGRELLVTKAILDFFVIMSLASNYGVGVLFSFLPLLIYQGSIALLAQWAQNFFTDQIITDLSAVGGILLLALALNILKIKNISITNLLPSLIFVVVLTYIFG